MKTREQLAEWWNNHPAPWQTRLIELDLLRHNKPGNETLEQFAEQIRHELEQWGGNQ